jgi:hypothetical protein
MGSIAPTTDDAAAPVVWMAQVTVPMAPVRRPGARLAGAVRPSDIGHIAYLAASAISVELTAEAARRRAQEARCAPPKPKGSASKTIMPIRNLNVIGGRRSHRRSERSDSRGAL